MPGRAAQLLDSIEVKAAKGLELGPLTSPVVTREMGDIRYVDHVDTETLRARYASHRFVEIDRIVPIDYVIGAGTIRSAVGDDAPFDYIVASHVIEHVPDLIGWLLDVRSVLADDGVLTLAIPDQRCTFDALRAPTVTADIVAAHLDGATIPTSRQVFDHYSSAVSWHGAISWDEEPPFDELTPVHSEEEALERAFAASTSGDYDDVHCWVFTPRSFRRVLSGLQRLALVPFTVEHCTEAVGHEFFARLRPADPRAATTPPYGPGSPRAADAAVVRAELAAASAELDAMVRSRSWQITRPLRSVNAWRQRRIS